MMFDWQQDSKERYFRIAQEQIDTAGFRDFLRIDKSKFSVVADKAVKVHMQPIHRSGNMRMWWQVRRALKNLKEQQPPKNQYGKIGQTLFIYSHIEIEMEENEDEIKICDAE